MELYFKIWCPKQLSHHIDRWYVRSYSFCVIPIPSLTIDSVIKDINEYSKGWTYDTFFLEKRPFDWQDGYGAFSTSRSKLKTLGRNIDNQKNIHETMTYEEELIHILELHEIEYEQNELLE